MINLSGDGVPYDHEMIPGKGEGRDDLGSHFLLIHADMPCTIGIFKFCRHCTGPNLFSVCTSTAI